MIYLKSLFFNFLAAFFANQFLPGIIVSDQTKLPHVGGDLMFAAALGFLNSLIYPVLKLVKQEPTGMRIALIALIINFVAYAIVKLLPIGVNITSVEGYFFGAVVVSIVSFLTNFLEARANSHKMDIPS